jgi:hypothetical protein
MKFRTCEARRFLRFDLQNPNVFLLSPGWRNHELKKASMKKKATAKKPPQQKEPEKKKAFERTYRGGCHCGRIRFVVIGALDRVSECNCSICTKKGYVHWIVPRSAFRLLTQSDNIAAYAFNTKTAKHLFCPNCGVASFYIPRSDPDAFDVNVRCLEGVNLSKLEFDYFDGRNWEKAFHEREQARAAK